MKHLVAAILLLASSASAETTYGVEDQEVTHDCAKDPKVGIGVSRVKLTLTGTCENLIVSGSGSTVVGATKRAGISGDRNTLTLDTADTIIVIGNGNRVTWKQPLDPTLKKPKISITGKKNKVARAK